MHGQLTFLQLSAEFGGTKFGPFPGPEIRLGSDAAASDITLPEALGVFPQHVKILIQSDGSFIVAPTERTAAVHVFRGSGRPKHIATATALSSGDSFALVTAEGPRFVILSEQPKQDKSGPKRPKKKNMAPTKEGMWAEVKRIGFTQVFRSRAGNFFMTFWTRLKSGALFTPRVIIGFLFLSTGWMAAMFAGIAAIGGLFALSGSNTQLEEVRGDLADCQAYGDQDDIFSLAEGILGDDEWAASLRGDDAFHAAFVDEVGSISANREDYEWVFTTTSSDFTELRRYAEREQGLGPSVGRIFAYAAATPVQPERDWYMVRETVLGERDCGRGPGRVTYQQARNLAIPAMPTVLAPSAQFDVMSLEEKRALVLSARGLTQAEIEGYQSAEDEIISVPVGSNASNSCVYLAGEDAREEASELVAALRPSIGPTARGLPGEGQNYWVMSRIVRFVAAGVDLDFDRIEFDGNAPTPELDDLPSSQKDLIVAQAATLTARAAAISCFAALDRDQKDKAEEILGTLPSAIPCLAFLYEAGVI